MKEIGSATAAYSLVIFLVCLLLMVLYFCECGRNRGETPTSSDFKDMLVVVSMNGYKSKLLTRRELPWPLLEGSGKDQLKTSVTGRSQQKVQCKECSVETIL